MSASAPIRSRADIISQANIFGSSGSDISSGSSSEDDHTGEPARPIIGWIDDDGNISIRSDHSKDSNDSSQTADGNHDADQEKKSPQHSPGSNKGDNLSQRTLSTLVASLESSSGESFENCSSSPESSSSWSCRLCAHKNTAIASCCGLCNSDRATADTSQWRSPTAPSAATYDAVEEAVAAAAAQRKPRGYSSDSHRSDESSETDMTRRVRGSKSWSPPVKPSKAVRSLVTGDIDDSAFGSADIQPHNPSGQLQSWKNQARSEPPVSPTGQSSADESTSRAKSTRSTPNRLKQSVASKLLDLASSPKAQKIYYDEDSSSSVTSGDLEGETPVIANRPEPQQIVDITPPPRASPIIDSSRRRIVFPRQSESGGEGVPASDQLMVPRQLDVDNFREDRYDFSDFHSHTTITSGDITSGGVIHHVDLGDEHIDNVDIEQGLDESTDSVDMAVFDTSNNATTIYPGPLTSFDETVKTGNKSPPPLGSFPSTTPSSQSAVIGEDYKRRQRQVERRVFLRSRKGVIVCGGLLLCILAIIIALSVILAQLSGDGSDKEDTATLAPTPAEIPTLITAPPSPAPTSIPTALPTETLLTDFVKAGDLLGSLEGHRFGSSVAMSGDGSVIVSTSVGLSDDPIRVFSPTDVGWSALPMIPWDSSELFVGDSMVDVQVVQGVPRVAIVSDTNLRILRLSADRTRWEPHGQKTIALKTDVNSVISYTSVVLSLDGSVVAVGSLKSGGTVIEVETYMFSDIGIWEPRGGSVIETFPAAGSALSFSMALSGDAQTLAVSSWSLSVPAVLLRTYEWNKENSLGWSSFGLNLPFAFGPSSVSLSENGQRLGVAISSPGSSFVLQRSEENEWVAVGQDLPGGSSISMSRGGNRALVGQALSNSVSIHDFDGGKWVEMLRLSGEANSRYGSSVSIASNGNLLAIGAPLDDRGGTNAGLLEIYQ